MSNRTLFLLSKGISHVGTRLFTFALSWYILSQTGRAEFQYLSAGELPAANYSLAAGREVQWPHPAPQPCLDSVRPDQRRRLLSAPGPSAFGFRLHHNFHAVRHLRNL